MAACHKSLRNRDLCADWSKGKYSAVIGPHSTWTGESNNFVSATIFVFGMIVANGNLSELEQSVNLDREQG